MADDNTKAWTRTQFGDEVSLAANVPLAARICRTYRLILEDALNLDAHLQRTVARDLTYAIWHFALGPLKAVFRNAGPGAARNNLETSLRTLIYWLLRAEIARIGQGLDAAFAYATALPQEMEQALRVSAISPLELLARLCWKQNGPASMGAYLGQLRGLNVARYAAPDTFGTPKVMFICSAHAPDFFVAESAAVWGTLRAVNGWVLGARLLRYINLPTDHIDALTTRFHELVVDTYNDNYGPDHINQDNLEGLSLAERNHLIQARKDAKDATAGDPTLCFNHGGELATATRPPTFGLKHRCYKCRALYRYDIVAGAEGDANRYFDDWSFPSRACGEVLCHCFCTQELERQAAEMQSKTKKQKLGSSGASKGGSGGSDSSTGGGRGGGSSSSFGGGSSSSVVTAF